jgi:hypothetical protein
LLRHGPAPFYRLAARGAIAKGPSVAQNLPEVPTMSFQAQVLVAIE